MNVSQPVSRVNAAPKGGWGATDERASLLDQAHDWGKEDATEGNDQRGSKYFPIATPAWHAYNEGYAAGCVTVALLTGVHRSYWLPQPVAAVSWNAAEVRNV